MRDENQLHAAVVEIYAHKGGQVKYSTVQNWYPGDKEGRGGIYNFVTKRGLCAGEHSKISWTQVETGSAITWKYPSVVLKGDQMEFTYVGYKPRLVEIPRNIEGNQYSIIQLLINDTAFLPAAIIKPRPTREQFERDFVNADIPDDNIEIARRNTDMATRRILMRSLPNDGRESVNMTLAKNAQRYYYTGQTPPMNILNPFAWSEFIKSWKRGDYKRK